MNNCTDVILEYNGASFPFGIQPRCRLGRMIEVVGNGLGIKINKIIHYQNKTLTKSQSLTDPSKYLLEDYGISHGQKIVIMGEQIGKPKLENEINIFLSYNGEKSPCQIFSHSRVKHIIEIVKQNMDLIPDSVKLKFNNNYLNDSTKILSDIGIKEGSEIEIEGKYFPLSLFGKDYHFMDNLGIHMEKECCICFNDNVNMHIFDCGHANVCNQCYESNENDKNEKCHACR